MIEFDLTVFLAHCVLFLSAVLLLDRFLLGPVYPLLDRRRLCLNEEGIHAERARRELFELEERYRQGKEEIHREGARIIQESRERGERETQKYLEQVRTEVTAWYEEQKDVLAAWQSEMERALAIYSEEYVTLAEEKLWGELPK